MERLVDWSVRSLCKIYVYHGVQSSFHVHRDGGETKAEEAAKDVSHDAKMVAKRRDVEPIPNPSPPFFSPSPHLRAGGDHASPVRGEGDGHHGALMLPVLGQQRRGADVEDPRQAVGEPAGERALSAGRPVGVGRTRAVGAAPGALPRRVELVQLLPRGDVPHPDGAVLGHRGGLCVVSMPTFAPRQRHVAGGLHVYTTRVNASCARTLFFVFFCSSHAYNTSVWARGRNTERERDTEPNTHKHRRVPRRFGDQRRRRARWRCASGGACGRRGRGCPASRANPRRWRRRSASRRRIQTPKSPQPRAPPRRSDEIF